MVFRNRKLLLDKNSDDASKKYEKCFICYVCPGDCSDYFSPPPLPPSDSLPSSQKHHISIFLIIMLAILGAAFLFLSYLAISRYRSSSRNWRPRRGSNPLPFDSEIFREDFLEGPVVDNPIWYIRTVGLPQSMIDSISVFTYKKGEGLIEGTDCSVCLSEFEEDERLRLLPKCSHAFHLPCIDTWLRSHKKCPVCRAPVQTTNANAQMNSGTGLDRSGSMEENVVMNEPEVNRPTEEIRRGVNLDLVGNQNNGNNDDADKIPEMLGNFGRRNGKFRAMSDLTDRTVRIDREVQAIRRSNSIDFGSVWRIDEKKDEGCSVDKQNFDAVEKRESLGLYRLMQSSSYGRSVLQIKGPVSMKKSFSFSGKRTFRKHSRSHESIPITELNLSNLR